MIKDDFFELGFIEPSEPDIIEFGKIGYSHPVLPFSVYVDDGYIVIEGDVELKSTNIKANKNNLSKLIKTFKEITEV